MKPTLSIPLCLVALLLAGCGPTSPENTISNDTGTVEAVLDNGNGCLVVWARFHATDTRWDTRLSFLTHQTYRVGDKIVITHAP